MCPPHTFSQTARVIAHPFISLSLAFTRIAFIAPNAGAVPSDSLAASLDSLRVRSLESRPFRTRVNTLINNIINLEKWNYNSHSNHTQLVGKKRFDE